MAKGKRTVDKHGEARESFTLPPELFDALDYMALKTNSVAKGGPNAGAPSWRTLIRRLARGELELVPVAPDGGVQS